LPVGGCAGGCVGWMVLAGKTKNRHGVRGGFCYTVSKARRAQIRVYAVAALSQANAN